MKEVITFLKSILKDKDIVIVATSGGPDSMCLLDVLKNNFNLKIICAHVNHNLREEAKEEAAYLKEYCQKNKIIFEYMVIENYKNNKFSESEGRKKRYSFFNELLKKYNAKYIFTAHHGNDLEETILMRIVRGSNLKGYAGIPIMSGNLVRPLLFLNKQEIIDYNNKNNIKYFVDKSNESENYTRNRYRKHMLPFLEKEDKMVHKKFYKFSEELLKYNNYINKIIKTKINNIYKDNCINIKELLKEDEFIQEKIIEYVIEDIQKEEIFNITDVQKNSIINLLHDNKNKFINLSDNFIARRSYNNLYIEKNNNVDTYNYEFNDYIKILDKYIIEKVSDEKKKSNNIIRLNSEELNLPLYIRCINKGDKIKIKNMSGSKKVSDIFIDSKVDLNKRKTFPLLVDNKNNIIWVPGIKKSIFDKEFSEKYDIILKYTEE